jgi:hypothetical protein
MRRRLAVLFAVLLGTVGFGTLHVGAGVSSSATHAAVPWYWTPSLCKSNLQRYGMKLSDGRTFNVAKAFCVGKGGTQWCMWSSSHSTRLYGAFTAYARSFDGVVRQFDLFTVTRENYRALNIRSLATNISPARFNAVVQPYATAQAAREHEKGCANYIP